jgi:DNA-binding NarL/FixJ family response regulator
MNRTSVHIIGGMRHVTPFEASGGCGFEIQCYEDEIEALNAAIKHRPQIILLHYAIRMEQTVCYIELLLRESPVSKIVIIGENLDDDAILDMLIAGANGYMELAEVKKFGNKMLLAIRRGEAWIGRKMVGKLLDRLRRMQPETIFENRRKINNVAAN